MFSFRLCVYGFEFGDKNDEAQHWGMPGLPIASRCAWRGGVKEIYAEAPVVSQGFGEG